MQQVHRAGRLRLSAFVLVTVLLAVFGGVFYYILQTSMTGMILGAESGYLEKRREAVRGTLETLEWHTRSVAGIISLWDDAILFVAGKNPDFIENDWAEQSLLRTYRFNFLFFMAPDGRVLYSETLNPETGQPLELPEGFDRAMAAMSVSTRNDFHNPVLARGSGEAGGRSGIYFYQGRAFYLSIEPMVREGDERLQGMVILGTVLDAHFLRRDTHYRDLEFTIAPFASGREAGSGVTLEHRDEGIIVSSLPLRDIYGSPLTMYMTENRDIFEQGKRVLDRTTMLLLSCMAVFAALLYWLVDRNLVRPALQLGSDLGALTRAEEDLKKRLEQQRLMSSISQSFIATADVPVLIDEALRLSGEFLDVSKILLARLNPEEGFMDEEYVWYNEAKDCLVQPFTRVPFKPGDVEYEAFTIENRFQVVVGDTREVPALDTARQHGLLALAEVPVYVEGSLWGMLSMAETVPRDWTASDVQLISMIGSIISGVLTRQATEQRLRLMSSIPESASQCICFVTTDGHFKYFNPAVVNTYGFSTEELQREGIKPFLSEEDYRQVVEEILPGVKDAGSGEFELLHHCKDGQERIMSISTFVTGAYEDGVGVIAQDITEKRLLEKALHQAIEQAEQSSRAKGEFLSRMSHEMRTPLNAVIGMTSIARNTGDPEKKEYCLDKIQDASTHLLGVINDILDMSKIEANKFELSFTEFNFEKMLMRVVNVISFRVDERNQNLIINLDKSISHTLISDEQRLSQVITNLLSNAVKFTPEGGTITVNVRKTDESDGLCTLRVDVTDTGIGISAEQQARLFTSFEQADGGISRKFGGTGLGLAISRSIVEMMGGTIWIESELGQGATFSFTIKARAGSEAVLTPGQQSWKDISVLVVDDAPEVLEFFRSFAESVGLRCQVAASGQEACRILEEQGPDSFNMVFADWKMPGMDGLELTRIIKETYGQKIVVIMISATQWSDIEEDARDAGVDHFIAKPLFGSLIMDCINQCLGKGLIAAAASDVSASSRDQDRYRGRRILLAEDIEINREIVLSLLEHTGLIIDCAENGRQAVEMFKAGPEAYEMIFMDIHMPEMDGYEATRSIRSLHVPQAATIPIIAMTANVFREDIERCLEAGMNGHVGKPLDLEEVHQVFVRYLGQGLT